MKKSDVYTQILTLKAVKSEPENQPFAIELIKTTGYVNIADMLLLPLYYIWERMGFGTLEDVRFESYLRNAYRLFCQATTDYTRLIVKLLRKVSVKRDLSQISKSIVAPLIRIYSDSFVV